MIVVKTANKISFFISNLKTWVLDTLEYSFETRYRWISVLVDDGVVSKKIWNVLLWFQLIEISNNVILHWVSFLKGFVTIHQIPALDILGCCMIAKKVCPEYKFRILISFSRISIFSCWLSLVINWLVSNFGNLTMFPPFFTTKVCSVVAGWVLDATNNEDFAQKLKNWRKTNIYHSGHL